MNRVPTGVVAAPVRLPMELRRGGSAKKPLKQRVVTTQFWIWWTSETDLRLTWYRICRELVSLPLLFMPSMNSATASTR